MTEESPESTAFPTSDILDIFVNFGLKLDSIHNELQKQNDAEQRRLSAQPNFIRKPDLWQGSGNHVVDFGAPQPGRVWHVRTICTVAKGFFTAAGVDVSWYSGPNVQQLGDFGILPVSALVWQFSSVPGFQKFSPGEFVVWQNEHLMVEYLGAPANSEWVSIVTLNEEPMKRGRPVVES